MDVRVRRAISMAINRDAIVARVMEGVAISPSGFGTYIKGKTAVKVDDLTVQIKTAKPYPLMPNDMSTFAIVSKKNGEGAVTKDYNSGKAAIGTGPFKFKEYVPGDRFVYVRNDD